MVGLLQKPFKKLALFLTVEIDLVYNGTRPFIPPRLRRNVIERAREFHEGISFNCNKKYDEAHILVAGIELRYSELRECMRQM